MRQLLWPSRSNDSQPRELYLCSITKENQCKPKEMGKKMEGETLVWKVYPSDKGLISRIYKELKQIYEKKINKPIQKQEKDINRHLTYMRPTNI
ncbi:retrotransposable element ORF2 protein [Plecturocebus cupreus]